MKFTMKFFLLAVAVLLSTSAIAQDADDIVNDYLKASGGADKLAAMTTMTMIGEATGPQGTAPSTRIMKAPNKSKMVINAMGSEMQFAYDGTTAWMVNPWVEGGKPTKLEGDDAKGISEEPFEDLFLNYAEKGHSVKFLGEEDIDDEEHYKVRLTTKDGKEMIYSFHMDTGLPTQMKMLMTEGQAKGSIMVIAFEDYKEVDGITKAHKVTTTIDGNVLRSFVMTELKINEEIDDSVFAFPEEKQ